MKIYKITEASDYLGVSINTLWLKMSLSNLMEFEKDIVVTIKKSDFFQD
jgi:hypothetical protein